MNHQTKTKWVLPALAAISVFAFLWSCVQDTSRTAIPSIDPVAEIIDLAPMLPKPPEAPVGARIGASDEGRAIADKLRETPKERRAREQAELKREDEASQEFMKRLMENQRDAG